MELENIYTITREIGIDMGHRIPLHQSKCKNIHGHRYKIFMTIQGKIVPDEEQTPESGMLMDFGFMKDEMMRYIDAIYDHALCLSASDSLTDLLVSDGRAFDMERQLPRAYDTTWGTVVVIQKYPTAENLAEMWGQSLIKPVYEHTQGRCSLKSLTVYETPNCSATYERVFRV